jgi:iron complex outermembrane receptor protein
MPSHLWEGANFFKLGNIMNFIYRSCSFVVAASFLAFPVFSAEEGESASNSLDEVIVTARKREESLLSISESVSAISGDAIDRQNIKGLDKVGLLTPNLNLAMRADGYPNVSMRGIGAFGLTQGVGFYLDDVQLFSDASSRFGDLERIEVLKGPQGTLYGGSNIGGAIKFVSKRPTVGDDSGRVKLQIGDRGVKDTEVSLNRDLNDGWAMRVFAYSREDDGFLTNPNSDNIDNQPVDAGAYEESGIRIAIAGQLADNLSLYASVRQNDYEGPVNAWARELGTPGNFTYPKLLDTGRNSSRDAETTGVHFELNWEMDGYDLTSITSYTDTESTRVTDVDLTQFWYFNTSRPEEMQITTQEVRLTSTTDSNLQWIAGVYISNYDRDMNSFLTFGPCAFTGTLATDCGEGFSMPFEVTNEENTHRAVFGNVSYEDGDWRYDLGLRADKWEEDESNLDAATNGGIHQSSISDTEILPRFSITRNYENSIAYFTSSQGYEPGGLNQAAPYTDAAGNRLLASFNKEEATQHELGWKGTILDGRGTASFAYFDIDYKDRAFQVVAPNPGGPGLIEYVYNVGDTEQDGVEVEFALKASENLTLTLASAWLNAKFVEGTVLPDGTDLSGQTPSNSISQSTMITSSYARTLNSGTDFTFDMQWSFNGQGISMPPTNPLKNPSHDVLNIQVGFSNGPWDFQITMDNVLGEDYYTDLEVFPNLSNDQAVIGDTFIIGTFGAPKLTQASLTYNF